MFPVTIISSDPENKKNFSCFRVTPDHSGKGVDKMRGIKDRPRQVPFLGSTCPALRRPGGCAQPRVCSHLLRLEGYGSSPVVAGAWKINPLIGTSFVSKVSGKMYLETTFGSAYEDPSQVDIKCSKCRMMDGNAKEDIQAPKSEENNNERRIPGLDGSSQLLIGSALSKQMGFVENGNSCTNEDKTQISTGSDCIKEGFSMKCATGTPNSRSIPTKTFWDLRGNKFELEQEFCPYT